MEGRLPALPGEFPTKKDWEDHLTTIFPEAGCRLACSAPRCSLALRVSGIHVTAVKLSCSIAYTVHALQGRAA